MNPGAFGPDVQFRVEGVGDCGSCIVTRSQPNQDNEIIIELYDLLPKNYDGWTGAKVVSFADVVGLFKMFEVREELWDDYYLRLMYFHDQLFEHRQKWAEEKRREEEATKVWRGRMRTH